MDDDEKTTWSYRIKKLDLALSLMTAVIEIGVFVSYVKNIITPEIAAMSGLTVAVIFLGQDSWRKRKALKGYGGHNVLNRRFPAVAAFVEARQSLPEEFRSDEQVLYDEMTYTCEISGFDGNFAKHAVGQNVSDNELDQMFHVVSGETSIENGSIKPRVFRKLQGNQLERLEPTVLWSSPNVKVIGVDLNPPVRPKTGKLDIAFYARWPGAFVSKNGYLFAAISQCVKGCRKLMIEAIFRERISQCSIWTWDLKKHKLEEFERLKRPKRRNNKFIIKWQRVNPDINKIYILRYKRTGENLV